jgi:hypothetical protein
MRLNLTSITRLACSCIQLMELASVVSGFRGVVHHQRYFLLQNADGISAANVQHSALTQVRCKRECLAMTCTFTLFEYTHVLLHVTYPGYAAGVSEMPPSLLCA